MEMVDQAIRSGVASVADAPPELVALFAELERVPPWVDPEALDRGGELLFRAGWFGGLALAHSLLFGYASPAGNKPLVLSGRLLDAVPRRLAETSRFVEQTCVPGGLRRGREGYAITVKVRVMHATIRKMLLASPHWRLEDWAVPANQHDMGATSLLFSVVVVETLRRFGFLFDDEEVDRYMQLWRYSGYLMGVHPDVLPAGEREARRLAEMIAATEEGPDEDSRRLSRAMFASGEDPQRATPAEVEKAKRMIKLGQGLIRGVMGERLADLLDVPRHEYRFAFPAVAAVVRTAELAAARAPASIRARYREAGLRSGRAYWSSIVDAIGEPISFGPPEGLAKRAVEFASSTTRSSDTLGSFARR
jgi:hypothetical protein